VVDPADPKAAPQIVRGIYAPDGWMADQATVVLKRGASPIRAAIFIPPQAPARNLKVLVDGETAASETFPGPGAYTVTIPVNGGTGDVTVTLMVDQTFFAAGDQRRLGVVITKIGFW
jgi:hypothetical protein